VVQATVVAEDALLAEALAKSVVISGSDEGLALAERAGAWAAFLLLESGEVVATPRSIGWLA
jgi:thiamine biosynthesis lipoprotein ApbE